MVGRGRIQPAHINTSLLRSIYAPSSYYSKLWLLSSYTKVRCWYGCSWPCILPGSIVFVLVGNVGGYTKNVRVGGYVCHASLGAAFASASCLPNLHAPFCALLFWRIAAPRRKLLGSKACWRHGYESHRSVRRGVHEAASPPSCMSPAPMEMPSSSPLLLTSKG